MSDTELVAVKFLKQWRAYNKDDVAGFDEGVAKKLVDGGVAEYHKVGKAAAPRAPQPSKAAAKEVNKPAASAAPANTDAAAAGEAGQQGGAGDEDFRP